MARAPRAKHHDDGAASQTSAERFEALLASVRVAGIDVACAVALEATQGWWVAMAGKVGCELDVASCNMKLPALPAIAVERARLWGADLAAQTLAEAVSEIGRLYTHALPADHRAAHGIFYTPPALVRRLLDQAEVAGVDWARARVISPSCGGGAFLVEDACRMASAMAGATPAIIVASVAARLRGWDRDPFACWLSHVAVEAALLPHVAASGKRLAPVTECRDSLMDPFDAHVGKYDLVNENPAFGKVKKSDDLTERFARSQRGHLNWYGLFLDLAVHLAKPKGGVVAYLTPTSYLGGEYFAKLRSLLASEARPTTIDLVESRQDVFPDVLQEVALSVFVRGRRARTAACASVRVEPEGLHVDDVGSLVLPKAPEGPWMIARNPASVRLVTAMQGMSTRLADWGWRVKTGPLVPHKNADRMSNTPTPGCVPVVWAESIASSGGAFAITCDRAGRKAWYAPRQGRDANVSSGAALLLQRTTAKEQRRRLVGAIMSERSVKLAGGRVAVENHVNMFVPCVAHPPVSLTDLARFFASEAADQAFRCISGSVAVSATELEALPLPSLGDLTKALAARDSEVELRRLYGIWDGEVSEAFAAKESNRAREAKPRRRRAGADASPATR